MLQGVASELLEEFGVVENMHGSTNGCEQRVGFHMMECKAVGCGEAFVWVLCNRVGEAACVTNDR